MKKYILFLIFLIGACSLRGQENKNLLLKINFSDFFKNDKVSLNINKQCIFKNKRMTSDVEGFTGMSIEIFDKQDETIVVFWKDKTISLRKIEPPIVLEIFVNGHLNLYNIDSGKGKYLDFDKKKTNELYFLQQSRPFQYD